MSLKVKGLAEFQVPYLHLPGKGSNYRGNNDSNNRNNNNINQK
jgi:hypothetical protein